VVELWIGLDVDKKEHDNTALLDLVLGIRVVVVVVLLGMVFWQTVGA
jgi:hypothetical protein